MPSFHSDLAFGQSGEARVLALFEAAGLPCGRCDGRAHDIWVEVENQRLNCECKADRYHRKSSNIALEYYNPRRNTPSGVTASRSDLWVTVLADSVWVARTADVKTFVAGLEPGPGVRRVERAGDGNADLWVVRDDLLLGGLFVRLDGGDPAAILAAQRP